LAPLLEAAPDDRATTLALARAQAAADDGAAAVATLERYAAIDPNDPAVWFALGREAVRSGDAQRGVDDYLVRAQVAYTRLRDARGQADVANALGVGYERLGQLDAAREQFERAASARIAAGDARGAAASLRNLAWVDAVRGEFAAAAAASRRARALLEPLGDDAAMASLVNDEGLIAEQRGDFREALARYREALALRQPLGNAALTAESLNNVGYAYIQSGEFDNARVFLDQARAAYQRLDDAPGIVRTGQSLAQAATHEGRWPQARAALEETLALAERHQMLEERAVSLAYLAELDRLEGRIADALGRIDAAQPLFAQRNDARGLAELALMRAAVLAAIGAGAEAEAALAPLASAAPPNREQQALLAVRQAGLALARDDHARALELARAARKAAVESHSLPVELEARLAEAEALAGAGGDDARSALAQVEAALERFPSHALGLEHARVALALAPAPGVAKAYADAVERLAATPDYVGAGAIHALAARRLADAGDTVGAARAQALARAARARLRVAAPPGLRAALDRSNETAAPEDSR
ncbi:MAG TPA: tetratricopeptide repeat protein, partial [Xanthomonadales bacterium]|nr:tetratricopeptide repeat protein [Xanthomonadales bacterium]